jgi:hypothetical protein
MAARPRKVRFDHAEDREFDGAWFVPWFMASGRHAREDTVTDL